MEKSIFSYILRYSKSQQLYLTFFILLYFPLQYATLNLPKIIIDDAIGGNAKAPFSLDLWLFHVPLGNNQYSFLWGLCGAYLVFVLLSGGLKYYINFYRGRLGERMLRRLRYSLYNRILRFPLPYFKKVSAGELIQIVATEVEPLGGFIGTSFSTPLFQGGQLLILVTFMVMQNWMLGLAAISMYPFQMYLIPKLQKKVNQLGKRRVLEVRKLSENLNESINGISDIYATHTQNYKQAYFSWRLSRIYWIRLEIYLRKYFIKFLNNFIDKLTPFFFYAIGGYFVIQGQISLGALAGVLLAYKDVAAPWRLLLQWYQQKEDTRIKYEQIKRRFEPEGLLEEKGDTQRVSIRQETLSTPPPLNEEAVLKTISFAGVSYQDDGDIDILNALQLKIKPNEHIAITGRDRSGKFEVGCLLAGIITPSSGQVLINSKGIGTIRPYILSQMIGYASAAGYLHAGSVKDNILYSLKYHPIGEDSRRKDEVEEAVLTQSSPWDYETDWVDPALAGCQNQATLKKRIMDLLHVVDLEPDIYQMGLNHTLALEQARTVQHDIIAVRRYVHEQLEKPENKNLIEIFDSKRYILNASVGENLLYGIPHKGVFNLEHLASHPYVRQVIEDNDLTIDFLEIGREAVRTVVDIFANLAQGHALFEQFSFIKQDELPSYQELLHRVDDGFEGLTAFQKQSLMSVVFRLVPSKHRLDVFDDVYIQKFVVKLLKARHCFAKHLPENLKGTIAFFDPNQYNETASLLDNMLFGKAVTTTDNVNGKINKLIGDVLRRMNLYPLVLQVGLHSSVGVGGVQLSLQQRQKVVIMRAMLRKTSILILNEALTGFDGNTASKIFKRIKVWQQGQGFVLVTDNGVLAQEMSRIVEIENGRIKSDDEPT